MGSHGEATAEGQLKILAHYGITEATMGCPMKSSMEVVEIGKVKGTTVFCDKNAWEADHIVVVGRVKAHTGLRRRDRERPLQDDGHRARASSTGPRTTIAPATTTATPRSSRWSARPSWTPATCSSAWGSSRTATTQTAKVQAILPKDFDAGGEGAARRRPRPGWPGCPSTSIDVLIVDELGKNISGAGMDPNVIGRASVQKPAGKPHVRMLFVRDITPESEGNAIGVGFADMTTKRLVRKINYAAMYMNAITSGVRRGGQGARWPSTRTARPSETALRHDRPDPAGAGPGRPDQEHAAPDRDRLLGSACWPR